MIASLHGTLLRIAEDEVVLECAGVGYRVIVAPAVIAGLPAVGQPTRLATYLAVREDAMTLYGFGTDSERELFEELLAVSGVGPKVAQALVAAMPLTDLVDAISSGDEARLTSVPGVGKRLAGRLVVELQDRIGKRGWAVVAAGEPTAGGAVAGEAIEALTGLGFTLAEARRAARAALARLGPQATLEDLVRESLRRVNDEG